MTITDQTVPGAAFARKLDLGSPAADHEIQFDGDRVLRLNQSALRQLIVFVREGCTALLKGKGLEVGGLLTGTISPDHSTVTLLDLVPLESEHRFGPAFRPSEADLSRFTEIVKECSRPPRSVIGYFRSHLFSTGSGEATVLREEDENLLERCFPGLDCAVILINPGLTNPGLVNVGAAEPGLLTPAAALLCRWQGGDTVRLAARLQLVTLPAAISAPVPGPVKAEQHVRASVAEATTKGAGLDPHPDSGGLPSPGLPSPGLPSPGLPSSGLPSPGLPSTGVQSPRIEPASVPPGRGETSWERPAIPANPESAEEPSGGVKPIWKKAAIAAVAVFALAAMFTLGRASAPRKAADQPAAKVLPLDMKVQALDRTLVVKWDPESEAARDSERASLVIVDGADVNRVELNPAQLRVGHYEYTAKQQNVTCLMTLYRNHNAFVGATQFVHLGPPGVPAEGTLDRKLAASGEKLFSGDKTSAALGKSGPQPQVPASGTAVPQNNPQSNNNAPPLRSFTPPPVGAPHVAPSPRVEEPPQLSPTEPKPGALPLLPRIPPITSPVAPPRSATPTPAAPAPVRSEPILVAPVPLARVTPRVPGALAIQRDVLIRIAVDIDSNGKVTGAHSLDGKDLLERMLSPYALQAARLWRFYPARRDGVAIASQTILAFQFNRN